MNGGARLRLARQARGFSQQQLAGMADVSRQAVSAVESGQSDPSLRVALALASALGMTVEELFGPEVQAPTVQARLVASPSGSAARVTLAPVGDSFVALPLSGPTASRAGFLAAGGLVVGGAGGLAVGGAARPGGTAAVRSGGTAAVRPIGPPRPTLVIAGCDPALPLLSEPLGLLDPPIALTWWPCSSQEALRLAADGLVHAAGAHLRDDAGDYNTTAVAGSFPGGGEVIGFSTWREGLVLSPAVAGRVRGVADLVGAGLRVVNREPGAEARRVLDRELAVLGVDGDQVPGYHTRATGHLEVAGAIAAGLAAGGIASEPAALAYGLSFVPIVAERFDLVIASALASSREVQALLKVLSSRWLLDQLASLPGYDPALCGQHIATLG